MLAGESHPHFTTINEFRLVHLEALKALFLEVLKLASLARKRMRDKLQTRDGKAVYARRKSIVEPALGQIKGARGFRRFSLRSFFKVRAEWTLVCLTLNLLKLYRSKLATVASV